MRRVVLDSNGVDPLIDLPGAYKVARAAVTAGQLELLFTHVTVTELRATRDPCRRSRLLGILVDLGRGVPTGAVALDVSELDHATLSDSADEVEALRSASIRHTRDALIATAALLETCALVTNERRLTNRARERGIEVLKTVELLAEFGFAPPA
jgi:predicted nucleic acid-binding protein